MCVVGFTSGSLFPRLALVAALTLGSVLSLLLPAKSCAEFIRTRPLVYQSRDGHAKIIVSESVPGVFVSWGPAMPVQEFDPVALGESATQHLFIAFDGALQRFHQVMIGRRTLHIAGSFSVHIGELQLTLGGEEAYLTISHGKDQGAPGIVGFRGTDELFNASGFAAITLLEANQLSEFRDLIKPYALSDGLLTLDGKTFGGSVLGVKPPVSNICLTKEAIILDEHDLEAASAAPNPAAGRRYLTQAISRARSHNPLRNSALLRITATELLTIDAQDKRIRVISERKGQGSNRTCISRTLKLAGLAPQR
jgi:hypothetical protein